MKVYRFIGFRLWGSPNINIVKILVVSCLLGKRDNLRATGSCLPTRFLHKRRLVCKEFSVEVPTLKKHTSNCFFQNRKAIYSTGI